MYCTDVDPSIYYTILLFIGYYILVIFLNYYVKQYYSSTNINL